LATSRARRLLPLTPEGTARLAFLSGAGAAGYPAPPILSAGALVEAALRPPSNAPAPTAPPTRAPISPRPTFALRAPELPFPFPRELLAPLERLDLGARPLLLAWETVCLAPELPAAEARAFFHLALATLVAIQQGHTGLPLLPRDAGSTDPLARALDPLGVAPATQVEARALGVRLADEAAARALRLARVVGPLGSGAPFALARGLLSTERVAEAEAAVAALIAARLVPAGGSPGDASTDAVTASAPHLTPAQATAVAAALTRPLTVITGGPGTGKTTIVRALVACLVEREIAPERIALAAPTGKAAHRLGAALAGLARAPAPPSTLHRLLAYSPHEATFDHHAARPLPFDVVIVDEASMIDLALMRALLEACAPRTRLVLLGDADQLPSVDAGALLREIGPIAQRLERSFRMDPTRAEGQALLEVAARVNRGEPELLAREGVPGVVLRARVADVRFEGVELLEVGPHGRAAFLDHWWRFAGGGDAAGEAGAHARARFVLRTDRGRPHPEDVDRGRALLAAVERTRLLCVTRGPSRPTGAAALNAAMQRRYRRTPGLPDLPRGPFLPGEPVILQRNDHERGLWNGDAGLVIRVVAEDGQLRLAVAFARGEELQVAPLPALRDSLELGYAITVHKAQGSELDSAALFLPETDLPLLNRPIIYTALTRCRRSVTVVGSRALLATAVARPDARVSSLGAALFARAG
jgi:exodeoxyribonuclease V alpha subunit